MIGAPRVMVVATWWLRASDRRAHRPWMALVICPLAMIPVALIADYWVLVPIAALCWWWANDDDWTWAWLLGILEACWGIQWAVIGSWNRWHDHRKYAW